jgi:hypothetical protein
MAIPFTESKEKTTIRDPNLVARIYENGEID